MHNFKLSFLTFMSHTLATLSLKPIRYLLFGMLTGIAYNAINVGVLFLLLFFLFTTTAIETILSTNERNKTKPPIKALLFFSLLSILILFFLAFVSNWIVSAILSLYLFYSILHYYPVSMTNSFYSTLLQPFFKVIILSVVSFFIQANFIPLDILKQLSPILFFYLFMIFYMQYNDLKFIQSQQLIDVLTTYQKIIIKFAKLLIPTSFLLAYLFSIFILISIGSAIWSTILFLLTILLSWPLLSINNNLIKYENYLSNYCFLFCLFYSLLFVN